MNGLLIFVGLAAAATVTIAIVALVRSNEALRRERRRQQQMGDMVRPLNDLVRRVEALENQAGTPKGAAAPTKEEPPTPVVAMPPTGEKAATPAPPTSPVWKKTPPVPPPVPKLARPRPELPPLPSRTPIAWEKLEEAIGKRWMTWVGVLGLFIAAGFFLKYAFDREWLGPGAQVLAAIAAGLVMVALGHFCIGKEMRALGQGLIGGGLMILYAALWAAYSPAVYEQPVIESQKLVFSLMCVVTVAGIVAAVHHSALPISFLAVLGGFLTPVLVSTGVNARDTLFAYILLLDLSVMAVAFYKRWRALDVLAFAGTVILFGMWYHEFYADDAAYAKVALVPTTLWLSTFYLVFLVLPFVNHLRYGTPVTVERFVMALANATFFFGYAWRLLHAEHETALALITAGMALLYLALAVFTRRRIRHDTRAFFAFVALSVTCLTVAIPLYFEMNGITLGWTAQACVLLYLGYRYAYRPVRVGAFLVLLLAVGRVFWVHWEQAHHEEVFRLILNREFLILMCAPVGAAVSAGLHQIYRRGATEADRVLKTICTIGAGLLFLTFLHVELEQWLALRAVARGVDPRHLTRCTLTILWALGATGFFAGGFRGRALPVLLAGLLPAFLAAVHAVALYTMRLEHSYMLVLNGRFWACLLALAVLVAYAIFSYRRSAIIVGLVGVAYAGLLLAHVEIWRWIQNASPDWETPGGYAANCSLAILWAAGSAAFLGVAKRRGSLETRRWGLPALALSALFMVALYGKGPTAPYWIFLNGRFVAGVVACVVLTAFAWSSVERLVRTYGFILSGYATLLLLHVEVWRWLEEVARRWKGSPTYHTTWIVGILWALGVGCYLAAARLRRSREAYWASLLPLGVATGCALRLYEVGVPGAGYALFFNARFLTGLAVCVAAFAAAVLLHADREALGERERWLARLLHWGGIVALLLLLSAEPYLWCHRVWGHIYPRPPKMTWSARMSVTIVWGVYASCLLVIGFWRRVRPYRFAALGLFGLAAAKLVVMDLAGVREIYRILSFFIVALLMLGGAYLYHKAPARIREMLGAGEDTGAAGEDT